MFLLRPVLKVYRVVGEGVSRFITLNPITLKPLSPKASGAFEGFGVRGIGFGARLQVP